jgi:hypothetical protein
VNVFDFLNYSLSNSVFETTYSPEEDSSTFPNVVNVCSVVCSVFDKVLLHTSDVLMRNSAPTGIRASVRTCNTGYSILQLKVWESWRPKVERGLFFLRVCLTVFRNQNSTPVESEHTSYLKHSNLIRYAECLLNNVCTVCRYVLYI